MNEELEPTRKSRVKTVLAVLVAVLLITNAMSLYLVFQKKGALDKTAAELHTRIEKFESLKRYFEAQQRELQIMGISNDSLNRRIEAIDRDLARLRSFKNASFTLEQQREYKKKFEELSESLDRREDFLRALKEQNDRLQKRNSELTAEKNSLSDSVSAFSAIIRVLTEKVTIASILKAENFRVTAINRRGKERSSDRFRASAIDKLRLMFTLSENAVAEHGEKHIFIRIIKPDGTLLQSAGTFKHKGDSLPYTVATTVYFADNKPQVDVLYDAEVRYVKGSYKAEIYCEGFRIGEGVFMVR